MTDWQPIETAPKNGTLIIVADADVGCFPMRWGHIQRNALFAPNTVGMWVASDGSFTWTDARGYGPTFWMPADDYTQETPMPPETDEA